MQTSLWTIKADGTVEEHGVDHGNGAKPMFLTTWNWTKNLIVVRVPSGRHFAGRFTDAQYHPASVIVLRVVRRRAGDEYECEKIITVDTPRVYDHEQRPDWLAELPETTP